MKMRIDALGVGWLLSLLTAAASAQSVQFKPSAHVAVEHDTNVFRAPTGPVAAAAPRQSDTVVSTGLAAKLSLEHSLQALELRGEFDRVRYAELTALDYERYRLGAETRLALASLLTLQLDAGRERRQENFVFRDDTEKGLITEDRASALLRLGVTPQWTGLARAERYQTEASRLQARDFNVTENTGELGAEYRINGYSSAGLAVRRSEGEYPFRIVISGDGREKQYEQQSLIARGSYTASGLSSLTAQLAYTQRRHDDPTVRDFGGITGRARYTRRFSGISQLQVEAYRDLFYIEDINANYVENLGLRLQLDYRYSIKTQLVLGSEYYDSSYQGSQNFSSTGPAREDQVFSVRIGLDYQPFYRLSILPEYRYEQRDSTTVNSRYDTGVIGIDLVYEYGLGNRR